MSNIQHCYIASIWQCTPAAINLGNILDSEPGTYNIFIIQIALRHSGFPIKAKSEYNHLMIPLRV